MALLFNNLDQFSDKNGVPLAGGKLYFYITGPGAVFLETYSDPELNNPNTNPVILDGKGRPKNDIWGDGVYRIVLTDKNDVQIAVAPFVGGGGESRAAFSDWVPTIIYDFNSITAGENGRFYISTQPNNLNNDPLAQPSLFWAEIQFIEAWNAGKNYPIDYLTLGGDGLFYNSIATPNLGNDPSGGGSPLFWESLTTAAALSYNPANSGLPATTVQGAIDAIMYIRQGVLDRPLLYLPMTRDFMGIGAGDVNYLRTLISYYVNRYDELILADEDSPRFESNGLLIEGAATNLALYSQQFDQVATWVPQSGAAVTADTQTAPDGTATADTLTLGALVDTSRIEQTIPVADSGQKVSFSIYVKEGSAPTAKLRVRTVGGTVLDELAEFEFATETFISNDFSGSQIQSLVNGWYRLTVTMQLNNTLNTDVVIAVVSPGVAGTVYIWQAQLEQFPYSTSLIVTTTTSATRPMDDVNVDWADNIPIIFNPWTVFLRFDTALFSASGEITLFVFGTNDPTQRILLVDDGSVAINDSLGNQELLPAGTVTARTATTLGITHDGGGNVRAFVGNVLGDPVVITFTAETGNGQLGNLAAGGESINGHMSDFRFYPVALLQQEIRHLTGGQ